MNAFFPTRHRISRSIQCNSLHGFTLVELLVVIAIIGILIALLLPAVQSAREASRRTGCVNNLHNLGLAMHGYADTHGVMPMGTHRRPSGGGRPPWQTNQASWIARVLPYLEEVELHDRIDWDLEPGDQGVNVDVMGVHLDIVRCPSDPIHEIKLEWISDGGHPLGAFAPTNYVVCMGDNDDAWIYTGVFGINSDTRIGQITDGTSQTMMISECKIAEPLVKYYGSLTGYHKCLAGTSRNTSRYNVEPRGFSWFYAQVNQSWNYNTILTPNDTVASKHECQMWSEKTTLAARSRHVGGVNVALADGSVRLVADEVDYDIWQYLGHMRDGQIIGTF